MDKTKRVGVAASSFLLAIVFAIAAFAFAGPVSNMGRSHAAQGAEQDVFGSPLNEVVSALGWDGVCDGPSSSAMALSEGYDDADSDPGEIGSWFGVANVSFVDGTTGLHLRDSWIHDGYLQADQVPVLIGKHLTRIEGLESVSPDNDENVVTCYYEDIPKLGVSVEGTDLVFGDTYTIKAVQDLTFSKNLNPLDATYYEDMGAMFSLAGAYDDVMDYKVTISGELSNGETIEEDVSYAFDYDYVNDMMVAVHRGYDTRQASFAESAPAFAGVRPVSMKMTFELVAKALYDEDAYGEDNPLPYDESTQQWIGQSDAMLLFGVDRYYEEDYNPSMMEAVAVPAAAGSMATDMATVAQMVRSDQGATEVRISDGAHLTVHKMVGFRDWNSGEQSISEQQDKQSRISYGIAEYVPYTIVVENDGSFPVTGARVRDDLTFSQWNLYQAENISEMERPGTIMPGERAVYYIGYYIKKADVERGYVENVAYIESMKCDVEGVRMSSTPGKVVVETAEEDAMLDVSKTIVDQKDKYSVGDEITYQIEVENNSPIDVNDVIFFEEFTGAGDLIEGTFDGEPFEWGTYTGENWEVVPGWSKPLPKSEDATSPLMTGRNAEADNVPEYDDNLRAVHIGDLPRGSRHVITTEYTITEEDMFALGCVYNSARAVGYVWNEEDPYDNEPIYIQGWNDSYVELSPSTAISLSKCLVGQPSDHVFKVGEDIVYDLTVTNTGDFPLSPVVMQDDSDISDSIVPSEEGILVDGDAFAVQALAPGESASVRLSHKVTEYDVGSTFGGTANAMATIVDSDWGVVPIGEEGDDDLDVWYPDFDLDDYISAIWPNAALNVCATADWSCSVENMKTPALKVDAAPVGTVSPGSNVTFEVAVENVSNVSINDIEVTDEHGHSVDVGTLAPGEKKSVSIADKVDGGYSNKVTVSGTTPERRIGGNENVSATDDLTADVRASEGTLVLKLSGDDVSRTHAFDVYGADGTKAATVVLDNKSEGSVTLPIGSYTIRHSNIADGFVKAGDVSFELVLDEGEPWNKPVVEKTIALSKQTGNISVSGSFDGKEVAGALYTVKDANGNIVAENAGAGVFSMLSPGIYTVSVAKAPEGFKAAGDTEKTVEIKTDTSGNPVISEEVSFDFVPNEGVKTGTLIIQSSTGEEADDTNTLAGAKYDLFADADIVDADGNILYHKGDKVDTILGEALNEVRVVIPIGTYRLVEVDAPEGFEPSVEPERFFDIGEAELIVTYVNVPTPQAPDDVAIPDSGNAPIDEHPVPVADGAPIAQAGDGSMFLVFATLAAVFVTAGIVILRRKAE